jgi:hypothetical protein
MRSTDESAVENVIGVGIVVIFVFLASAERKPAY